MQSLRSIAILILSCATGAAFAADESTVDGVVLDASGSVVPGATIALKRPDGSPVGSTTSDARGTFAFERVTPGRYDVAAHLDGFKDGVSHVTTGHGAPQPVRIVLEIAGLAEEVVVERDAASTRGATNRDALTVDQALLQDLPVFDQDYVATLSSFLDPGALGESGVSLVVDGAEANRAPVSPSSIQEVKINQNPYSAEFFRPGRGRIEIVTKQGAPAYHGSLALFARDASLNARDFFATVKPPERRFIYEGSLSGPVGRSTTTTFQLSFDHRSNDAQAIVLAQTPGGAVRENVATPQRGTDVSFRVTRQLGKTDTLWAEYVLEDSSNRNQGVGGFTLPEAGTDARYREHSVNVNDQHLFADKGVNQLHLHLEWNRGSTTSSTAAPRIVVQDAFTGGGAQADQRQDEMDVKLFESLSWSAGRHLLKAGVQVAEWSHRTYDDLGNRDGTFSFSSLDDYLAGTPYAFTLRAGDGHAALFQQVLGGYAQDEIQVRRDLTVALGARYDYQNLLHDGRMSPRLYAAYSPGEKPSLIFRAGVGVFPDRFPPWVFADVLRYDGSHLRSYLLLDPDYPTPSGVPVASEPTNLVRLQPSIRVPYSIQWSAGAEWQIAKGSTLSATYRADRGVDLLRSRDVNAPVAPAYDVRPDPSLGRVRVIESAGRQEGDALDLSFRCKLGRVNATAQYTLSRARNDTSGVWFYPARSQDPRAEWAYADFDQRHRLNVLGTIDLKPVVKIGLALTAASGRPYTLVTGQDDNRDGLPLDRPDGVGRNSLRLPGSVNVDLKLTRELFLDASKRDKGPTAALSVAFFNVLDTENVSAIVGNESSTFFRQPVAALPARRVQLDARVSF